MKNKIVITVALISLTLIRLSCPEDFDVGFELSSDVGMLAIEPGHAANIILTGVEKEEKNGDFFYVELENTNLPGLSINGCDSVAFEANSGTCTLTINVPSGTVQGDYYVNIKGWAYIIDAEQKSDPQEITITVPGPDFSIAFETDSIRVLPGQSDTVAINIARYHNNIEGIDFVIETFDPLLNGAISPAGNVTSNTTNYILNVDPLISPGNHSVIVTGMGVTTSVSRSDTLEITVTTASTTMWVEETPPGFETTVFNDVYFINENAGVTVGNNGAILRTGDGGDNWINETGITTNPLRGVHSGGSVWYAVGRNINKGEIIRSTTGSWERVTDTIPTTLNDVFVKDANNIWTVGDGGVAYYTTDGGATWIPKTIAAGDLKQIWFTTSSEGFIGSSLPNKIFKTTDGGNNWTEVHSISSGALYNLFFIDSQKGYVVYNTGVDVTTTGGGSGSWSPVSNLTASSGLTAISFWGSQFGLIVGGSGGTQHVLRTEDGGISWETEMVYVSGFQFFNAIAILNQNAAVAVGQWGIARRFVE